MTMTIARLRSPADERASPAQVAIIDSDESSLLVSPFGIPATGTVYINWLRIQQ